MRRVLVLLALVLALGSTAPAAAEEVLMMATTTSTDDTGLLDVLGPQFKADTGIELRWTAVGTGKALAMGESCDVDVLLVHAPKAEKEFVAKGALLDRTEVMYNDFVIVGPAPDPAGIKGPDAAKALKAIQDKGAAFISRGDDSGTHKTELGLWKAVGLAVPDKAPWYVQAGQGMIATLRIAAEKNGYTLTDRGTWITYEASAEAKGTPLAIVVEGDKVLFNQYSVLAVNPAKCPSAKYELATTFRKWMASPKTQQLIAGFKLMGKQLFTPNAKSE